MQNYTDNKGNELIIGAVYKVVAGTRYAAEGDVLVLIKPVHFGWQEWYEEFQAYQFYNLTAGMIMPRFWFTHLLELSDKSALDLIRGLESNINKVRACEALGVHYEIRL